MARPLRPLERGERTPHQLLVPRADPLKTGKLDAGYFRIKFGVEILEHCRDEWRHYIEEGYVEIEGDDIRLTRRACCGPMACCRLSSSRSTKDCGTRKGHNNF